MELRALLLAALLLISSGCVAFSPRHIGFTASSSYLKISRNHQDNLVYHEQRSAYTLAPIGFVALLALDIILLPLTLTHDLIVSLRADESVEVPAPAGTYTHKYRNAIHSIIAVR